MDFKHNSTLLIHKISLHSLLYYETLNSFDFKSMNMNLKEKCETKSWSWILLFDSEEEIDNNLESTKHASSCCCGLVGESCKWMD